MLARQVMMIMMLNYYDKNKNNIMRMNRVVRCCCLLYILLSQLKAFCFSCLGPRASPPLSQRRAKCRHLGWFVSFRFGVISEDDHVTSLTNLWTLLFPSQFLVLTSFQPLSLAIIMRKCYAHNMIRLKAGFLMSLVREENGI